MGGLLEQASLLATVGPGAITGPQHPFLSPAFCDTLSQHFVPGGSEQLSTLALSGCGGSKGPFTVITRPLETTGRYPESSPSPDTLAPALMEQASSPS